MSRHRTLHHSRVFLPFLSVSHTQRFSRHRKMLQSSLPFQQNR
jgi:hypothetical protein